jgi:choline dehydrogenase-like flavoprotein
MTIGRAAILTQNHNGRLACHYCGPCERGCITHSYFNSIGSTLPAARRTGRLTLRPHSVVAEVLYDPKRGRARGVRVIDANTMQSREYAARVVFLCASTIESIRLLLNSKSSKHPNGLANSSGLVGRYFMDQTISLAFAEAPSWPGYFEQPDSAPHDPFYHPAGGILIPRFANLDGQPPASFLRGLSFQGAGGRFPVPEGHPTSFGIGGVGEMLPDADNRITIDPRRKDAWGVPAPHIRVALSENDRVHVREQLRMLREMLDYAGYRVNFIGSVLGLDSKKVFPDANPLNRFLFRAGISRSLALGAAIHECGGARMGTDPATSVVNSYNQAWDVPNLFITDGSCFVTNSTVGPTLTIMAVTARACEYAAREHADGALRRPTMSAA